MTLVFWASFLLLFYIYFGYPLVAKALATFRSRPVITSQEELPSISILIAAYNEANDIEATLLNKLELNFPKDRIEILVVSDESDDGTDEIVEKVASSASIPVRLFRQVPRQGKTSGLNLLYKYALGDILLFSDANSQWDANAAQLLVRNFSDPTVGYVTGKMVYINDDGTLVGDGCSAYMKYENWLRGQETGFGSIVGVDGGIDAMRKDLYQPLRADQLPDFVQPLKVVEQGYRVIYEPQAMLKEEALTDSNSEFSMRVRVSLRALWALKDMKHLMNPIKYPVFAMQMISHKLLRYSAFLPMVTLALSALFLAQHAAFYALAAFGYLTFVMLAWQGHRKQRSGQSLSAFYSIPYYFMLVNIASYWACVAFMKGQKKVLWNPRKG